MFARFRDTLYRTKNTKKMLNLIDENRSRFIQKPFSMSIEMVNSFERYQKKRKEICQTKAEQLISTK